MPLAARKDGTMKFLWPELLWLLVLLPLLAAARLWLLRRRRAQLAGAWPGMFDAAPAVRPAGEPAHVRAGVLLLFAGLGALIVAMARPMWALPETGPDQTIVLAIDLSGSMAAADIAPNRLAAAQKAAKKFVQELPRGVQVAVVAYADSAELVQPPTLVRERATEAIDRFQLQGGTAIGDGILTALGALFPGQALDLSSVQQPPPAHALSTQPAVAPGSYAEGLIVLLTDGENTMGSDPLDAARLAAQRGVKVCTVGFGTADGAIVRSEGASEHVGLDEAGLKEIARLTAGEYFRATNVDELKQVYTELKGRLVTRMHETEATAVAAALGALLLLAAAGLSLWRTGAVA